MDIVEIPAEFKGFHVSVAGTHLFGSMSSS